MSATVGRTVLLVLDGVGVGAAPDAPAYGDEGSDSVGNTARAVGGLALPHLGRLGIGHLTSIHGTPPDPHPAAAYGKIAEKSAGKDSTTGHWEICGIVTERPFPTYPDGFPADVIAPFERAIGRGTLGNCAISGTTVLQQLGDEHVRSGKPIVYTSADSVFQIATHEDVISVPELYRWCEIARTQLQGEHNVGRVIARPFVGRSGAYHRTPRRRDFTVPPPSRSLLDVLHASGRDVVGIGKIEDLFSGRGLTRAEHVASNAEALEATLVALSDATPGSLIFVNVNDFDTVWGHRNDVAGYAGGLRAFDAWLPRLHAALQPGDLCILTADHGNDPTTPSTDHSREYIPVLAWRPGARGTQALGVRNGLGDIAATILEVQGFDERLGGRSFAAALGTP